MFKHTRGNQIYDLSMIGTFKPVDEETTVEYDMHGFSIGDVLFFDPVSNKFDKAIAINYLDSEVCGVVSTIVNNNCFKILTKGLIKTNKFAMYQEDLPLYLSDTISGKLTNIKPQTIVKQIATTSKDGIIIDIQRGYKNEPSETHTDEEFELYTKEELDEIINTIY